MVGILHRYKLAQPNGGSMSRRYARKASSFFKFYSTPEIISADTYLDIIRYCNMSTS